MQRSTASRGSAGNINKSGVVGVLSLGEMAEELQTIYRELGLVPHRLVSAHLVTR